MRRYLVIGVSVYLFELLVIVIAQALGMGSVAAVGLSFWLGLIVSFGLQKVVAFGDKRLHHRVLLPQLLAFSLLVLFNFGFTVGLTGLLDSWLPAVWCRTLALGITTIWNFYLYKTRIFKWKGTVVRRPKSLSKRLQQQWKRALKHYRRWRRMPRVKRLRKFASRPRVGTVYLYGSLTVLAATTLLWTVLGARLQQSNADQLVNARLFADRATLHGAVFPDQHSFLIKWPLFYIIRLFDYTPAAFLWVTILSVMLTIGAFVYLLWRIERRPLVLGTLCLALASVLLLVPAQPYAGALLPVNMAMLATRNLEYVLYAGALVCLIKAPGWRSRQFLWSAVFLGLLLASDKLFLPVSMLGALGAMFAYSLSKRWELAGLAARWLLLTVVAAVGAIAAISVISHGHLTHITGNQTGPYGVAQGAKPVALGVLFAVGGLLTNFGANPAYDATALRHIPHSLWDHLVSLAAPAYLINLLILLFALGVAGCFLIGTIRGKQLKVPEVPAVRQLTVALLWAALAVTALFVATDHYHQVDARYLTLWLFALFVALAGWARPRRVDAELVAVIFPILLLGIICGTVGAIQTYTGQRQGLESIDRRNKTVAQTLSSHHVKVLVGDYWRVLPVQSLSPGRGQKIVPLQTCTQPRVALTSRDWQPDLGHASFAYLLSFDKSLTDYPQCSLEQVVKAYGIPNSTALIDGSFAHPKEVLLFYDGGTHFPTARPSRAQTSAAVLPVELGDLPHTGCQGPTAMNIVAHQDDDLLFMNPDVSHAIKDGECIRTVYLTAGDAGSSRPYWLSRELGSEAAYSEMTGSKAAWMHRTVRLPGGQFVTVANLRSDDRISLIFMHLPDGNLDGQGFGASHHESLAALESGKIKKLETVDGQSSYGAAQLANALTELMQTYQPSAIRTQSNYPGEQFKDHSDHRTAGRFAVRAYQRYEAKQFNNTVVIPLIFYTGYPVHQLPPNVEGQDLQEKEAAFVAYARFDNSVCFAAFGCQQNPVYGIYLPRQYQNPY